MSEIGSKYHWLVVLDDDSFVYQVDPETGEKFGYDDLDLKRVRVFELWDHEALGRVLRVNFAEGERLTWRRRAEINSADGVVECCHIVAKTTPTAKGVLGIFESDGHIEMVSDYLPNSEWFYPPTLHSNEVQDG